MKTLLKNILIYFTLIILCSYPISIYISKNFNTYQKQNWALKVANLNLDYAVLGSSRVFNMIDIKSLDSTFNKKGINLGTSGSGYAENYIILSEFISKNKIKELILNTDEFCFNSKNSYNNPFHENEFLPLFNKYSDIFYEHIPRWKFYLWKTIPATKYIEYNKQFVFYNQLLMDVNMGSELLKVEYNKKELTYKRNQTTSMEIDEHYFYKIIHLCNSNNIKVILITTPIYNNNHEYGASIFSKKIKLLSAKLNLSYYGFEDLIENNEVFFNDNTHTNKLGSKEYSINLGKKLKNNNE